MAALNPSAAWVATAVAAEVDALKIGVLLPPEEPQSRSVREGVLLAKEKANKRNTKPLDIIIRGRVGQWGADGVEAARMVTEDGVDGLIAPPDGAASHLALQVSGRTAVPVVTLCADSSVGRTGVPWLLRIVPRTTDEAKALFTGIPPLATSQTNHWLALVPEGHAGREISRDLSQAALGSAIHFEKIVEFNATPSNGELVCSQVLTNGANVVLLWLDPSPAAKVAKSLRTAGYHGVLAGPGRLQCADFVNAAGEALDGFIVPAIVRLAENSARLRSFQTDYHQRWGHLPDTMAAMSYDAAMLLSHLLSQPEFQMPPHRLTPGFSWPGVTGDLAFDAAGNRAVQLELLQTHEGKFIRIAKAN